MQMTYAVFMNFQFECLTSVALMFYSILTERVLVQFLVQSISTLWTFWGF